MGRAQARGDGSGDLKDSGGWQLMTGANELGQGLTFDQFHNDERKLLVDVTASPSADQAQQREK